MAVKIVIDTNIWISSLLNPHGFPAKLRESFKEGVFNVVISETMLEELAEVLNRPRIKNKYGISDLPEPARIVQAGRSRREKILRNS